MKNFTKFLTIAIIGLAFSASTFAQTEATATATATILSPIAITKTVDMDFGTLAGSGTAGTVVLTTASGVSSTGGVTIVGGSPAAASFTVTGMTDAGFDFNLPVSITLTDPSSNTMTVTNFVDNAPATITTGSVVIRVGGTLNVGIGQPAGTYTNTTDLTATVNYN